MAASAKASIEMEDTGLGSDPSLLIIELPWYYGER